MSNKPYHNHWVQQGSEDAAAQSQPRFSSTFLKKFGACLIGFAIVMMLWHSFAGSNTHYSKAPAATNAQSQKVAMRTIPVSLPNAQSDSEA